jgi:hypothetical protein
MGFEAGWSGGMRPPAATRAEIDAAADQFRRDLTRAALSWVLQETSIVFGCDAGRTWLALTGARDRQSAQLRQVAIYIAHALLSLSEAECARIFGVSRSAAAKAVAAVEDRREDRRFGGKLQAVEARVAQRLGLSGSGVLAGEMAA